MTKSKLTKLNEKINECANEILKLINPLLEKSPALVLNTLVELGYFARQELIRMDAHIEIQQVMNKALNAIKELHAEEEEKVLH